MKKLSKYLPLVAVLGVLGVMAAFQSGLLSINFDKILSRDPSSSVETIDQNQEAGSSGIKIYLRVMNKTTGVETNAISRSNALEALRGDEFRYTVVIANEGEKALENGKLSVKLPDGIELFPLEENSAEHEIKSVEPGQQIYYEVNTKLNKNEPGEIKTDVTLTSNGVDLAKDVVYIMSNGSGP